MTILSNARAAKDGVRAAPSSLAERALELLRASERPLPAAELAMGVFGVRASGPWPTILDGILAGDVRFERTDDAWGLAKRDFPRPPTGELVALALATTGTDVRRHRVVRVCGVRFDGSTIVCRFDAVVNPRRRLPRYLSAATRLSQEEADEAPTFGEVAAAFREFLGDAPIVAYGARWMVDLLGAELARADLPSLQNRAVELDDLVRRHLIEKGKPSLPALAEQLGIGHPRPNYPPSDAEVVARATAALLQMSDEPGSADPPSSRCPGATDTAAPRALLDRRWLAEVPERPGVYLIEDTDGAVLYVGKAVNLRRRLASYLGRSFGLNRQLEGLAARATRVSTVNTPSDLEARLLEARLVRRHRPAFNVARRARPRSLVIRCAPNDAVPRLHLARAIAADGAVYVGPFRSERAARAALTLVRTVYPHACFRKVRDRTVQRDGVQAGIRLLAGQRGEAVDVLRRAMAASSACRNYAESERCRRLIEAVLDFELRAFPLIGTSLAESIVALEPADESGSRRVHLIERGHLVASTTVDAADDIGSSVLDELLSRRVAPDDEEDSHLVLQWLGEIDARYTVVPASTAATPDSR